MVLLKAKINSRFAVCSLSHFEYCSCDTVITKLISMYTCYLIACAVQI